MTKSLVTNVTANPFDEVVYVQTTFPNGAMFGGSGVMVGPNDVLTASHMLYDTRYGGAATTVTVIPAYDASTGSQPFGSYTSNSFHYFTNVDPNADGSFYSGNGGAGLEGSEADVAIIDLSSAIGNTTGWMTMDPAFSSGTVHMTGFPADYGFRMTDEVGTVQRSSVDSTLTYVSGLASTPGNSGGPLWYSDGNGEHVVGVVSTTLWGADIDGAYNTLQGWISGNDGLIGGSVTTPPPSYTEPTPIYTEPTPVYTDPTPIYSDPTPTRGNGNGLAKGHARRGTAEELSDDSSAAPLNTGSHGVANAHDAGAPQDWVIDAMRAFNANDDGHHGVRLDSELRAELMQNLQALTHGAAGADWLVG
jgi:V8-like Glu-specific endopeptidase